MGTSSVTGHTPASSSLESASKQAEQPTPTRFFNIPLKQAGIPSQSSNSGDRDASALFSSSQTSPGGATATPSENSATSTTSARSLRGELARTQYSTSGTRLDEHGTFVQDRFPLLNSLMNFIRRTFGRTSNTISDKNVSRYLHGAAQELQIHAANLSRVDTRQRSQDARDLISFYHENKTHFTTHAADTANLCQCVQLLDPELFNKLVTGKSFAEPSQDNEWDYVQHNDGMATETNDFIPNVLLNAVVQALAENIAIAATTSKFDGGPGLSGKTVVVNLLNSGFTIEHILAISTTVISNKAIREGVAKYNENKEPDQQINLSEPEITAKLQLRRSSELVAARTHELRAEDDYVHGYVVKRVDKPADQLQKTDFQYCDVVIANDNKCSYLDQKSKRITLLHHEWNLPPGRTLSTYEVKKHLDAVDTPPVPGLNVWARTQVVRDNKGNILGYGVRPHGSRSLAEDESTKADPVSGNPYFLRSTQQLGAAQAKKAPRGSFKKLTGMTPARDTSSWTNGNHNRLKTPTHRVIEQAQLAPAQLKAVELTNSLYRGGTSAAFAGENENPALRRVLAEYPHFVSTTRTGLNTVIAPQLDRVLFSDLGGIPTKTGELTRGRITTFSPNQYRGAAADVDNAFAKCGFVNRDEKLENAGLNGSNEVCFFDFDLALTDADFAPGAPPIKPQGSVP